MNCKSQDDPYLIQSLQNDYIRKPDISKEYSFNVPIEEIKEKGPSSLARDVDELIFKNQLSNGFFLEAGATDGEQWSNTLFFEMERNWTGLLIEPLPFDLMSKNRKAHIAPVCLSTKTIPEIANFDLHAVRGENNQPISMGGIVADEVENDMVFKIQCFPLYSLLLAMGNPTVHYLILDIEGAELQVLRTVPWEQVDIQV